MSLVPPEPSLLAPGFRLDRYELLCPIAEGGMAQVWIARLRGKHGFEKHVAIKTILPKYAADLRFQNMFLDEARIASGIEHTNVAHILDLGEEHGVLYLAMEYVDGDALTKLHRAVEKKKELIPPGILLRIIADTCGGLHAAHELRGKNGEPLGVVHRDVSPQNILVSTKGVAKLIDFGIAKARDRLAGDTNTGSGLKGKVQYMAPEQALGSSTDRRADLWALGAILYHYLSGNPPFEGPNQLATLHRLTCGQPPLPLPSSVPAPMVAAVKRALAFKPAERFATAAEMQAALEKAMVESGQVTTTAEVAAYLEKEIPERAQRRREAIELALSAAAERARMQQLLRPNSADSSSGFADVSPRIAEKVLSPLSMGGSIASEPPPPTAAGVPPVPLSGDVSLRLPPPPSVPTAAAASFDTPAFALPRARTLPLVVGGVGLVGIVVGVVATMALRSGDAPVTASRPPMAATSVAAPPPPPAPSPLDSAIATASSAPSADPLPDPTPATSETATATHAARTTAPSRPSKPAPAPTPRTIPKVIDNGF